jgi:hypothetical protein
MNNRRGFPAQFLSKERLFGVILLWYYGTNYLECSGKDIMFENQTPRQL